MHTCIHTYTHIHTRTHIHRDTQTYTHTHAHTYTHTRLVQFTIYYKCANDMLLLYHNQYFILFMSFVITINFKSVNQ